MGKVYYLDQNYEELKRQAASDGELFCDPHFPPTDESLFLNPSENGLGGEVTWVRANELVENPQLFVDGACSCDVVQGRLGNCWFVAACSTLAQEKALWNKVIPEYKDQDWNPEKTDNYNGIFRFNFYRFGEWTEVVVDDFLPTINGSLVYISSRDKNEFWGSLLEKAYAKLAGCYEALDGGNLYDALVDFTGGISQTIDLEPDKNPEERAALFKEMSKASKRRSLMCAAIVPLSKEEMEQSIEVGLVKGHAYGITRITKVMVGDEPDILKIFGDSRESIPMIRLRNPWGAKEWNGRWSDMSEEWSSLSPQQKEKLELTFDEDGEFWMEFDDFCTYFSQLSIVRIVNTALLSLEETWHKKEFFGAWAKGEDWSNRAGGCLNNRDTFVQNPQIRFEISRIKESKVMIYLQQRDKRINMKEGVKNLTIGITIVGAAMNQRKRLHKIVRKVDSSEFMTSRSVFWSGVLPEGRYIVIPCTYEPGLEGEYLLSLYSEVDLDAKQLEDEAPTPGIFSCMSALPTLVTYVTVFEATGLSKQDMFGTADPYCIVKCGSEKVKLPTMVETLEPVWNHSVLFYRKTLDDPLKVQVWNANVTLDTVMGKAVLDSEAASEPKEEVLDLTCKKDQDVDIVTGNIRVRIHTVEDLFYY